MRSIKILSLLYKQKLHHNQGNHVKQCTHSHPKVTWIFLLSLCCCLYALQSLEMHVHCNKWHQSNINVQRPLCSKSIPDLVNKCSSKVGVQYLLLYCCCSVTKSCLTFCDPMNCSMPGFPVLHYPPELAQTHVHESVIPSNHLNLWCPLLLLPSIFSSIRVFSNVFRVFALTIYSGSIKSSVYNIQFHTCNFSCHFTLL